MLTLGDIYKWEEEIKKSRFIAAAGPVSTPDETFAFLDKVKDPQATHNCWAFRIGTYYRFSDDGEPKGTAGRPILTAIERQGLDRVMIVVTRFFGGIKLGAGGLTRAYGGVASACLREASFKEVVPMATVRFDAGFELVNSIHALLKQEDVEKLEEAFTDKGIRITARLQKTALPAFEKAILNLSRGAVRINIVAKDPE
jgi:uncharacterized YigZ family protein